jgi:signal transduction histidine kinase
VLPAQAKYRANLRSIIYNLLSNAIKYASPERPPYVVFETFREGTYTVLCIQDNGLGIPESQQPKLFSMFKRFHSHVDGTGVGLYMIKRVIENNRGKIEVQSTEGLGAQFKVYFP